MGFIDEIRRKKQAEAEAKQKQQIEKAVQESKKREEELKQQQLKQQAAEEARQREKYRQELFKRLDPMVSEVLKVLGRETWGRWSYKIERKVPEFWLLSHYRGKVKTVTRGLHIDRLGYTKTPVYHDDIYEGYEGYIVRLEDDSIFRREPIQYYFTVQMRADDRNHLDKQDQHTVITSPEVEYRSGHIPLSELMVELSQNGLEQALLAVEPIRWVFDKKWVISGKPQEKN